MTEKPLLSPSSSVVNDVAIDYGHCYTTKMIAQQEQKIGYMYRDDPQSENDSGWVFLSGNETEEIMTKPDSFHIYDVNTIAKSNPDILAFLDAPYGTGYQRDEQGQFVKMVE